jgi:hypothetical protein
METLHADLIPYVINGMVHHRLVITSLTTDPSFVNKIYRDKLDKVKRAEADGDWSLYVSLHERPYRLDALLSAPKKGLKKNPSQFWSLVGNVWQDSENIHQNLRKWKRVWGMPIEGRRACMSAEDLRVFDLLPEQIEVWRGTSHKRYVDGISWTLDQEKAIWFARRFCSKPRVPLVARGVAEKGDVLAYFGGRKEREIVSMRVSIISAAEMDHTSSDSG